MFFVHSSDDGHLDYFHIFSSVQRREMRKEVEKRQQEEEASKVMGRYAWRQ